MLTGLREDQRIDIGHGYSYEATLRHADGSESFASRRVAARRKDLPTLHRAIGDWLHRTPIQGSRPDTPDDAQVVARFIDAYCACHDRETRNAMELMRHDGLTERDTAQLDQRIERERTLTRAFLLAEDVPEAERTWRSRVRAALVFIEGYRELPLLAWPREVVDALVAFEQAMLIFRQRHARMVERIIGRRVGTGGSSGVEYLDHTALAYRIFGDLWAVRTLLIRKEGLPPVDRPEAYEVQAGG